MFFRVLFLRLWLMFGHIRTFMLREVVLVRQKERSMEHHAHIKLAEITRQMDDIGALEPLMENGAVYAGILAVAYTAMVLEGGAGD